MKRSDLHFQYQLVFFSVFDTVVIWNIFVHLPFNAEFVMNSDEY